MDAPAVPPRSAREVRVAARVDSRPAPSAEVEKAAGALANPSAASACDPRQQSVQRSRATRRDTAHRSMRALAPRCIPAASPTHSSAASAAHRGAAHVVSMSISSWISSWMVVPCNCHPPPVCSTPGATHPGAHGQTFETRGVGQQGARTSVRGVARVAGLRRAAGQLPGQGLIFRLSVVQGRPA